VEQAQEQGQQNQQDEKHEKWKKRMMMLLANKILIWHSYMINNK
jgi:hypothetical protein